MTQIEALKLLGVNDLSNSVEALEIRLFDLKKEIIVFCHVPQLLISKKKKLNQLISISETLNYPIDEFSESIILHANDSEVILESFNTYHLNRTLLMQKITLSNNCRFIISCIDLLIKNTQIWCEKWPLIKLNQELEVKISKELDSILMLQTIKSLKNLDIHKFIDLREEDLAHPLLQEIRRLNLILQYLNSSKNENLFNN